MSGKSLESWGLFLLLFKVIWKFFCVSWNKLWSYLLHSFWIKVSVWDHFVVRSLMLVICKNQWKYKHAHKWSEYSSILEDTDSWNGTRIIIQVLFTCALLVHICSSLPVYFTYIITYTCILSFLCERNMWYCLSWCIHKIIVAN